MSANLDERKYLVFFRPSLALVRSRSRLRRHVTSLDDIPTRSQRERTDVEENERLYRYLYGYESRDCGLLLVRSAISPLGRLRKCIATSKGK